MRRKHAVRKDTSEKVYQRVPLADKFPAPMAKGGRGHKEENQPRNGSMDKSEKPTQKDTTQKENTSPRSPSNSREHNVIQLHEMEEKKKRWDVRKELEIKSIRVKLKREAWNVTDTCCEWDWKE